MERIYIAGKMIPGLRGVITSKKIEIGAKVMVNEIEFTAKNVRPLLICWYAKKSALTIRCGHQYFTMSTNRMKFLNACGFSTEKEFMMQHMQKPVMVFGMAETTRYFVDFYDPGY